MLEILKYGNEKLQQHCSEVVKFDDELKHFADEMYETMIENHGIGLAASQVGVMLKLIVIDTKEDEKDEKNNENNPDKNQYLGRINLVNPKIIGYSVKTIVMEEGCLSVPGIWARVERPASIRVKAKDLNGKTFEINAKGILARVIQHEIDHLKGELFVEKVLEEDIEKILPDLELIKEGKEVPPKQRKSSRKLERVEI